MKKMKKKFFITGAAGFIGFNLSYYLLQNKYTVLGFDGITDYYDVELKKNRLKILKKFPNFSFHEGMLEDYKKWYPIVEEFSPEIIIHLAAQAGVRYSLKNPRSFIDSNIIGSYNILEF